MPQGQIITIAGAKGGCGKTTLATNLAAVLHDDGARLVCLVDLDLEFGDVSSMLALRPGASMVEILEQGGRLDNATVASLMTPYRPGLDCLLAPTRPGDSQRIPAVLVTQLLAVLPSIYDFVIVDTSSRFSPHVLAALDAADHQVLLTTPERPALKNLRITLDMLDLLTDHHGSRSVVFNRSDIRVQLPLRDVDALIRTPVAVRLPLRWEVPASVNEGVPLAERRTRVGHHWSGRPGPVRRLSDVLGAGRTSGEPDEPAVEGGERVGREDRHQRAGDHERSERQRRLAAAASARQHDHRDNRTQ